MVLNFYLEFAGLLVCVLLWIVSSGQYKKIDLKAKIYVHMVRVTTIILGCNVIAYYIIKKNLSYLMTVAEIIIGFSFLMMVWIWTYLIYYLIEVVYNRNYFSSRTSAMVGIPLFMDIVIMFMNVGTHSVYDVIEVEDSVQVIFNTWYKVPYLIVAVSLLLYLVIAIRNHNVLKEKRQYIFYVIPILLISIYYLQYRIKSTVVLGFGYSVALLLLYMYSYSSSMKLDGLTRLPDGATFKKMLDYRIGQKQSMTIAMITLDDFKQVNREYGYHNGSRFLKLIAKYITSQAPKQCLARYSGDKFAIVFDEQSIQDTLSWCDNVLERFEHSWELGKLRHKLSVCISLVEYPAMADTSEEILDLLEYMNTYGKLNKRNQYIICNDAFKEKIQRRLHIASTLNDIVQQRKMYVKYQPILEVVENAYTRAEALFRLEDEQLGTVEPAEFFPIAEENGYIIDIGYILLEQVCQYMKTIQEEGKETPIISVNFFRQQIMDENVEQKVQAILQKYDIAPERIAFELPESVFAMQYNAVKEQIQKVHDMGCRFYLDGFGNAFLDLSHLMELPFEVIKINKSMIREAEQNDSVYLLVSAMTAVFEENGKLILGDGIESEHLKEMADLLFMDFLQGHYISEPLSEETAKEAFAREHVIENMPNLDALPEVSLSQEDEMIEVLK